MLLLVVVGVLNSNGLRLDNRQHDLETKIVIRGSRYIFLYVERLVYKHACNCDILMIESKITYFFSHPNSTEFHDVRKNPPAQ
jgi:hypothetical protein